LISESSDVSYCTDSFP